MILEIDPTSDVAIYQQIRDRLVEAIARGELAVGQQVSSVRALAGAFGINVATVQKAYDLLRREGLLRTTSKSGSVVARGPASGPPADAVVAQWRERMSTVLAEARAQGVPDEVVLAQCREVVEGFARVREGS
ncbi:GntR family transcriptional regulator [Kineococcus sp. GCM10028916]|uniref:GntR family transcriptional regulator n=1 Tax=Kineococcus sp. GCM10028916 TaxID=3273394 RepID=UPI00362F99D2